MKNIVARHYIRDLGNKECHLSLDPILQQPAFIFSNDFFHIHSSINNGLSFLENCQSKDSGHWVDFETNRSGPSDVWITAYVLSRLNNILTGPNFNKSLLFLLQTVKDNAGWGFNTQTPADCDSTIFALEALFSSIPDFDIFKYLPIIFRLQKKGGGFSTYYDEETLQNFRSYGIGRNTYQGWLDEHTCVTSEVIWFLNQIYMLDYSTPLIRAIDWLLSRQHREGYWVPYWWRSLYYVFPRVLSLILSFQNTRYADRIKLGSSFIINTQSNYGFWSNGFDNDEPCILSTCWAVDGLLAIRPTPISIITKAIRWLLKSQQLDGSWAASPCLQIPPPSLINPEIHKFRRHAKGVGSCCVDSSRVYGTTTVLHTLLLFIKGIKNE
jgi:hypothetical protein